ncbi:MAG: rod shape-determining protein RodA [Deltaproteobacteria bacterium]|nr:rod shape-determining protein RodA [Deltaproteobacteria bacterium]
MTSGTGPGRTRRIVLDLPLVFAVACIAVLGLLNLRSAVSVVNLTFYETQLKWFAAGGTAALVVWLVDHRVFLRYTWVAYAVVVLLLVLVLVVGRQANQAQRWLNLGPIGLQPSEFMKIAIILAVARLFHGEVRPEPRTLKDFLLPAALTAVPTALVLKQPDLGTALIYPLIFLSMAMLLRVRARSVLFAGLGIAVTVPIAWSFLHGYQKERVVTFFASLFSKEQLDVQDAAWQTTQSKIAVGSGHIFGKGFLHGTQNQLGFVPFQHTDFPFAVWGEEHGFVGVALLIALYLFVVLWALRIASRARDRFGALVAVGVAAMIFWHVAINMGMVLGLLPVVGVTLPLFSYGGSSVLANLLGVGLLLSISARRTGSPWEGLGGRR